MALYVAAMMAKYPCRDDITYVGNWRITLSTGDDSTRTLAVATKHGIRPETKIETFTTRDEAQSWAEGLR